MNMGPNEFKALWAKYVAEPDVYGSFHLTMAHAARAMFDDGKRPFQLTTMIRSHLRVERDLPADQRPFTNLFHEKWAQKIAQGRPL